ncbi:MAG: Si-specific NAD(P)(+) transhydrogenase [Acidobacteria bacterium]|nr:Si-specific NAD(P)(+) transhydrogenase [Acidobacteriota bacterium]
MFDLIVIGSGPAGEKGAAQAAYFGKRVALIERESVLGGASTNTGTIPSKTLRESALHLSGFRQRGFRDAVELTMKTDITVADFMYRKQLVVERERMRIEDNLFRHHIERFPGSARFLSPKSIEVVSATGRQVLEADVFLIATGSSPHRPSHVPFDDEHICDSDTILRMTSMPKSLAIVGAGVIGCEYASIFAALGVEVHLIDGRTTLLGNVDREIVRVLLGEMQQRLGVTLHLGVDVDLIEHSGDAIALTLKDGSAFVADKVLYAAGRDSNTADLGLEAAGVATGKRGVILVDENYQTNVPHIYAAGDVIGFPALASTSMEQARVAMVQAFDLKYKQRLGKLLPYAIYTIPELATVGMTEDDARQNGIAYGTGRGSFRNNARGQIIGDTKGLLKIVFEKATLKILGVHIVGENASELLHIGLMAMHFDATLNAFIDCVFNFPTLGEAYKYAAYDGLGSLALKPKMKT